MSKILLAILKSLSIGQIVTFVFMTAAPFVINSVVKDPTLAAHLIELAASIGVVLTSILRKPSQDGGTVSTQLDGGK